MPLLQVQDVLTAAFEQFPRLGYVEQKMSGRKEDVAVVLRGWSTNPANQIRFHNQAMQCCKVSIREISKRRALWHDRQPVAVADAPDPSAAEAPPQDPGPPVTSRAPAPATPPA